MYRTLRIIFCILAVLIAAAAIFIFVYLGWQWGLVAVLGVLTFFSAGPPGPPPAPFYLSFYLP